MATTSVLLSIAEYLHTSYEPDVHFVDGELEERNVGKYEHAKIQFLIASIFGANEDAWQVDVVVEQRIRVSATHVRVCDIAVLRADTPHEEVTETPPLLCIEVMSPEDRLPRVEVVLGDYRAMGVPDIWLIDPLRRVAYMFGADGLQPVRELKLAVPGTPIAVDVAALFAKLDEKLDKKLGVREQ